MRCSCYEEMQSHLAPRIVPIVDKLRDRYMKPRYENTKNYKEQLWLLAYHMEKSIRVRAHSLGSMSFGRCRSNHAAQAMDESKGITQWAWIMDFKVRISNSRPASPYCSISMLISSQPCRASLCRTRRRSRRSARRWICSVTDIRSASASLSSSMHHSTLPSSSLYVPLYRRGHCVT